MGKLVRLTALIGVLVLASGAPAFARGGGGGGGDGGGGGGHFGGGGGLGGGRPAGGAHGGVFRQRRIPGAHLLGAPGVQKRHLSIEMSGVIRGTAPLGRLL